jgi:hypothetical protein
LQVRILRAAIDADGSVHDRQTTERLNFRG